MRDNHDGMPELLRAYERDGLYFGAVAITLGSTRREFEFGVPHNDYIGLRRILQTRPFDQLPGLLYRFFITGGVSQKTSNSDCEMSIRVEQGRTARGFPFQVPKSLAANLLWFARLRDFAEASHLRAP
jgi:hypothetical protein